MNHRANNRDKRHSAAQFEYRMKLVAIALVTAFTLSLVVPFATLAWYRTRPIVKTRSYSPFEGPKTYIDIVAVRDSDSLLGIFESALALNEPRYRFELHDADGHLRSSTVRYTGSYQPGSSKVIWNRPGQADAYLDDSPEFTMQDGVWRKSE